MSEQVRKPSTRKVSRDGISLLIKQFAGDEGAVREESREALAKIGEPAVGPLVEALSDFNPQVRWEAVKTLGEIGSPAAAPALVESLNDREFDVRWLAAEALIRIGPASAVPLLRALMAGEDRTWFLEGAHHVLYHLAGLDRDVPHHIYDHPWLKEFKIRDVLAPVLAALDGPEPPVEVPLAARAALEQLNKTG